VPMNSVHERVEILDREGTRIALTRDQSHRSRLPAHVTHQLADGTMVDPGSCRGGPAGLHRPPSASSDPMRAFLSAVASPDVAERGHPCSVRGSLGTWTLVKGIYDNATW
jgi:hypothetical protein